MGGGGKEAQTAAFCSGGEWVGVETKKQSQACGCGAVTFGKVFFGGNLNTRVYFNFLQS